MGQVFNTQPGAGSGGGTGVTAAAVIAANAVVIGDDGARGVKGSIVAIDNSGNITGVVSLAIGGATIGTDVLAWTGTATGSGRLSAGGITDTGNGAASVASFLLNGTLFTGGNGTTTFPQLLFQPTGTSAVAGWSTAGTHIGVNAVSGFAGQFLDFHVAGAGALFNVQSTGGVFANGGFSIGAASFASWAGRGILTSPAAGSIQLGANDLAAPVAQILRAQSVVAGTSNTAGQSMTVIGSLSTGSGVSGDIVFQTGGTGAGAAVQNGAVTALTLKGATQTVLIASGVALQLGNTRAAGVLVQGGSVTMLDSTGTTITVLTT